MADFDRLLLRTSRTFALSIPLLPEPPRREVRLAYLLLRIADTFEDAASWPRALRIEALERFAALLAEPAAQKARALADAWTLARPCEDEGYLELLGEIPAVMAELTTLLPRRREIVVKHALRTVEGMINVVASGADDGSILLGNLEELKRYCFIVAGIVGELLTDLFLEVVPGLERKRASLCARAADFGEGLQLVNILKDSVSDARDGRVYLPPSIERAEIIALARADLSRATEYVMTLQAAGAPEGFLAFTALPVLLARASLANIERFGAGAKIDRREVTALLDGLQHALRTGDALFPPLC